MSLYYVNEPVIIRLVRLHGACVGGSGGDSRSEPLASSSEIGAAIPDPLLLKPTRIIFKYPQSKNLASARGP